MKRVLLILCLVSLPAIAQSTNITKIPPEATVFKITFQANEGPDGQDIVYGAIKIRGEFLQDSYPTDDSDVPPNIVILSDSPSKPGEIKVAKRHLDVVQTETSQLRLKRYEDEGFAVAKSKSGAEMLVPKVAVDRANELADMKMALAQAAQDRISPYEEHVLAAEASEQKPGLLSSWGRHALIVIVTGLALFGILKSCFQ